MQPDQYPLSSFQTAGVLPIMFMPYGSLDPMSPFVRHLHSILLRFKFHDRLEGIEVFHLPSYPFDCKIRNYTYIIDKCLIMVEVDRKDKLSILMSQH